METIKLTNGERTIEVPIHLLHRFLDLGWTTV